MRDGQLVLLLALGLFGQQRKTMRLSCEGGSGEENIKEICDSLTSLLDFARLIGEPTYSADATLILQRHCWLLSWNELSSENSHFKKRHVEQFRGRAVQY